RSMRISNIIPICYGIPGLLAYCLVIYAMYGVRRVLNRSFIVIFVLTALINIATWINGWPSLRLQNEPLFFFVFEFFNDHPLISDVHNFLIAHFYFAQNVCVFLLTADRCVVIFSLTSNTLWWNKGYVHIALISHLVCLAVHLWAR
ncbi:hypothetical protein PFISCL1PPCAC_13538, partial [Pristionchus fissidentatus]